MTYFFIANFFHNPGHRTRAKRQWRMFRGRSDRAKTVESWQRKVEKLLFIPMFKSAGSALVTLGEVPQYEVF